MVEYDQVVAEHEHGVGHAEGVPLRDRQAFEVRRNVVGEVTHGASLEGRQVGMGGNGERMLESGDEVQRVVVGLGLGVTASIGHRGLTVAQAGDGTRPASHK